HYLTTLPDSTPRPGLARAGPVPRLAAAVGAYPEHSGPIAEPQADLDALGALLGPGPAAAEEIMAGDGSAGLHQAQAHVTRLLAAAQPLDVQAGLDAWGWLLGRDLATAEEMVTAGLFPDVAVAEAHIARLLGAGLV